jgi:hypothetical protein
MPIEIRELHIRVSVNAPAASKPAGAPGSVPGTADEAREALVAECVERLIEILHDRQER